MEPAEEFRATAGSHSGTGFGTIRCRLRAEHEPSGPSTLAIIGPTVMGLCTRDIKNMDDLFVHTLRDIYYAEKQIVKALPDMVEKASDPQLKQGFQTHLRETENHVKRLEQVFQLTGKKAQGVDCPAIDGILKEANEVAGEVEKKSVLDAALIAAAQAAEAYEMKPLGNLVA